MIELKNVCKTYETGNKAIRNINLRIRDGEFVFIVGKSGSGKSTLFKLLTRELKATSGEIMVNGCDLGRIKRRNIPKYRRTLGVVFQDFRLLYDRNVFENVAFAQRVIGASPSEIKKNVPEMLKLTGLGAKYKAYPNHLSGGEQQRVAIARALINHPQVLLADEPTGNLDSYNTHEIMKLLETVNSMGTTVIVITHSKEMVDEMKKRVITMDKGLIVSDETPEGKSLSVMTVRGGNTSGKGRSRKRPEISVENTDYWPDTNEAETDDSEKYYQEERLYENRPDSRGSGKRRHR